MGKGKNFGAFFSFFAVSLILFFIVYVATFFIGGGLLNILGFEYYSTMDVMKFFFVYLLISFIADPISRGFTGALEEIQILNSTVTKVIKFILLVGTDIVVVSMAESFIDGVFIKNETMIIFAVICYIGEAMMERYLEKDEKVEET